jgi:2-polyprenyl-3-methyl-5-hydroxy-6-metoxy-1,4-benzoquinol methylase
MSEAAALERISSEYTQPDPGRLIDRKFQAWTVDRLLGWVRGPEVLELGFGDGQWTGCLLDRFGHSHVVDASATLLAQARAAHGPQLRTYVSLFEQFSPDHAFDTVIASFVLEHVQDPVEVLGRAAGWLAPGGHVLVAVPHADSIHRRLAVCMGLQQKTEELGPTDQRLGHRRNYTIARLEADVARAGLRVVRRRGLLCKPLPQGMMAGFADAMLEGFMRLGDEVPIEYAALLGFDCAAAAG